MSVENSSSKNKNTLSVSLNRIDKKYLFKAKGKTGVPVYIDNVSQEEAKGVSPMELLLMGVGGCSAIDVIHILEKQKQTIEEYRVVVNGERKEVLQAKPFERMEVEIHLKGTIDPNKAKRAAKLSFEKYCSVSITFSKTVAINYKVIVNEKEV